MLSESHLIYKLGGQVIFAQPVDGLFFGTTVQSDHDLGAYQPLRSLTVGAMPLIFPALHPHAATAGGPGRRSPRLKRACGVSAQRSGRAALLW